MERVFEFLMVKLSYIYQIKFGIFIYQVFPLINFNKSCLLPISYYWNTCVVLIDT